MPAGCKTVCTQPATPAELQQFVQDYFGVHVPARPMCPHHDAPLDYLVASFLEQRDILVWANRGGGKTYLAAIGTLLDVLFHGPVQILVLGGSFDQSDRLAEYIRQTLTFHPELIVGKATQTRLQLLGGSEIRMLAQSQRAVRGRHVQKIRCDEVDLFDPDVWRAVQFATRSHRSVRGSIEVLSTLHRANGLMQKLVNQAVQVADSSAGYHLVRWCLWDVIERCPSWRKCDRCPLADDCRGLAREADGFFAIDDAITIQARSSRSAWETEMLCQGVRSDEMVFPEFDLAKHVKPIEYVRDWPLFRAIDFGYRSPLVCLWVQLTPDGRVNVLDEYVRAGLPIGQHAAAILNHGSLGPMNVVMTYVDPAGRAKEATSGAACTELLTAAGIPCASRCSAIVDGLELIRAALAPATGAATLTIHPRCRKLAKAFQAYHFEESRGKGFNETPVKDGPDHLIDALRYFFVNRCRPGYDTRRGRY